MNPKTCTWMLCGTVVLGACLHGCKRHTPAKTPAANAAAHAPAPAPTAKTKTVTPKPAQRQSLTVTRTEVSRPSFNPSRGQTSSLHFEINKPATVTVIVYGPNREEIRRVVEKADFEAGLHEVSWDGCDGDGDVVPDEAYFFTLQAVSGEDGAVVDPLLNSGGERVIASKIRSFDDATKLSYHLPRPCRVLVRAAVVDGPLLRTIVNWEPRPAGLSLERWDGKDADGLRSILEVPESKIAVVAFGLPDLTTITVGNVARTYRDYYVSVGNQRPKKVSVIRAPLPEGVISPHSKLPPHLNRDPGLNLTLSSPVTATADESTNAAADESAAGSPSENEQAKNAASAIVPVSAKTMLVRVDIPDELERRFMNEQKFELIIYVDDHRTLEVEQGRIPFTYPWDVSTLSAGRHILTVNVASFRNHVGTVSRMVDVRR